MSAPETSLSPERVAEAVAWRQHLHKHPELAYSERQTADFVASQLARFGLTVHRGLAGTGVVGTLQRGMGRRTIGIRADMDALRIQECTGAPYTSSIDGVMHACGHDGHVAMALAAARACVELPALDGTVHFIFQPAEEGGAGARRMMEDGLFKLFPCDAVFALHNWPALPLGSCVALDGGMMAANAVFEIEVSGRGCHAAMPHEGTDCLLASCHLVTALQGIVSRNLDPFQAGVISVTQIHSGEMHNVIPNSCALCGTARWFDNHVGDTIERRINELARAVAAGFGCEVKVNFERRYPATINDPASAQVVRGIASTSALNLNVVDANPSMASEDFAFMLQAVPGCYFWLGTACGSGMHGLHSPRYDFNDDLIPTGVALWVALVRERLTRA